MPGFAASFQPGRLLIDAPASGAWNMAMDQALMQSVQETGVPVLRFYRWDRPTLSLGYFQRFSDRSLHEASCGLPVVRRSTGGGAIVHDRELTYSIALPIADRLSGASAGCYQVIHEAIVEAVGAMGVRLVRFADTPSFSQFFDGSVSQDEPFLCFQRRTEEDLILSGYKVAGSAQRRNSGALLQHGSILLAASLAAPELPGISELTSMDMPFDALATEIAERTSQRLRICWAVIPPSSKDSKRAELICEQRFSSESWTVKR
jgi:lipoyl(octanoyl) transferase